MPFVQDASMEGGAFGQFFTGLIEGKKGTYSQNQIAREKLRALEEKQKLDEKYRQARFEFDERKLEQAEDTLAMEEMYRRQRQEAFVGRAAAQFHELQKKGGVNFLDDPDMREMQTRISNAQAAIAAGGFDEQAAAMLIEDVTREEQEFQEAKLRDRALGRIAQFENESMDQSGPRITPEMAQTMRLGLESGSLDPYQAMSYLDEIALAVVDDRLIQEKSFRAAEAIDRFGGFHRLPRPLQEQWAKMPADATTEDYDVFLFKLQTAEMSPEAVQRAMFERLWDRAVEEGELDQSSAEEAEDLISQMSFLAAAYSRVAPSSQAVQELHAQTSGVDKVEDEVGNEDAEGQARRASIAESMNLEVQALEEKKKKEEFQRSASQTGPFISPYLPKTRP